MRKMSSMVVLTLLFLASLLSSGPARAQGLQVPLSTGETEAWLITYGPGQVYWERFGHNAIWIRDPLRNIDHVFNSGFFDFQQERFLSRFIEGRMLYFSAARPANEEFLQYWFQDRSINAQKLNLGMEELDRLIDHLVTQVQPENRDYRYDYYLDNCSTRVRDALDVALGGALHSATADVAANQNFRDHTRRSVSSAPGYYLALQLALGHPVDRDISRWDEMFLPAAVADQIASMNYKGQPLVTVEQELTGSVLPLPPAEPPRTWPGYLMWSLAAIALFAVLSRFAGAVMSLGSVNAVLMLAGTGGVLLGYLWLFTDHQVAGPNANLLLLNPLMLLGLWQRLRRVTAVIMAAALGLSVMLLALPGAQYNLDVLAFLGPINAIVAWLLWTRKWEGIRHSLGNPFKQNAG